MAVLPSLTGTNVVVISFFFDIAVLGAGSEKEQSARLAWEVACSWEIEPDHARQIASRL